MNLDDFEKLAFRRQAVRRYQLQPIPDELIERLIKIAQRAPNPFNLQPTHYYVVKDPATKEAIFPACMKQRQILESYAVVIFAGDRDAYKNNLEKVIEGDLKAGAISEKYAERLRVFVELSFSCKPLGFGYLAKLLFGPISRLFSPSPEIPAVYTRSWLYKVVSLNAMSFIHAAEAAHLATSPMEGFDEGRLKRILKIPRRFVIPMIVAVGYPAEKPPMKSRLPIEDVLHWI